MQLLNSDYMPAKSVKRTRAAVLHVMTTPAMLKAWRQRARDSGMSMREWVERSLINAPVLKVEIIEVVKAKEAS